MPSRTRSQAKFEDLKFQRANAKLRDEIKKKKKDYRDFIKICENAIEELESMEQDLITMKYKSIWLYCQ